MRSAIEMSLRSCSRREGDEIRKARHGAVVVDGLAQNTGRVEAGQAREVHRGLGVSRALEDASLTVAEREDVARAGKVLGLRLGVDDSADRRGPVRGGDAGRHVAPRVDRDGERRSAQVRVRGDHQRDLEFVEAVAEHRHTDHPARIPHDEGDGLRCDLFRGHDEIALVLSIGVVDDDDDAAPPNVLDGVRDRREDRSLDGPAPLHLLAHVDRPSALIRIRALRPGQRVRQDCAPRTSR